MKIRVIAGLAAGAAVLFATSAFAQDTVTPPSWTWTQFYAGLGVSDNLAQATPDGGVSTVVDGTPQLAPGVIQGAKADILAGYMHQFGGVVVGGEADLDLGGPISLNRGTVYNNSSIGPCFQGTTDCAIAGVSGNLDTLGHIRVLAGVPVLPSLLVFGTTGVAFANAEIDGAYSEARQAGSGSSSRNWNTPQTGTLVGWTIGIGAQYAVTNHISLRGEVYHDFYGTMGSNAPFSANVTAGTSSASASIVKGVDFQNTAARAALIVGF